MSKYWFIEFEDGERAGFQSVRLVTSQQVHDIVLERYEKELIYVYPCQKWELEYSEVDMYYAL